MWAIRTSGLLDALTSLFFTPSPAGQPPTLPLNAVIYEKLLRDRILLRDSPTRALKAHSRANSPRAPLLPPSSPTASRRC
ncbi:hypothetical protein K432DRAFT_382858 [Lepidopterella palustris CBS 459.81]|uniref:Uncharacterized protein n=1 Tax=Lepidopterella palustris CBS 459.81 TaxID=1314670 RepID=A0A8E2E9A7_9PEZI|nr:hypothetical protein K432DRAFT_382858 [Lepidopterella palustris CBS 459.81]